jgi:putative PIN family toxin of toxin-antitoxin system
MSIKAVLDTNILVAGLANRFGAPAKVIDRWLDGQFIVLYSTPVFDEYSRILLSHPKVLRNDATTFLNALPESAQTVSIAEKLSVCKDPSDNVFLETALEGKAEYLVTKNIKHFPFKRYQHVEIARVSKFLKRLEKEFG